MTLAELKKLFGEQPELYKEVLAHIATTEEGKELLTNFAKTQVDKVTSEKETEINTALEATLKELGFTKPANKKATDFVKDLAGELKELKEKPAGGKDEGKDGERIKELEGQLKTLKEANWEGKYTALVGETATKIEGFTNQIKELQNGNTSSLVNVELSNGLSGIKFNHLIPKEAIDAMTSVVKEKVIKTAKVVDGKVVYYKEDGTPYLNELFKPITAEEIFKTELKAVITGANVSGGGADAVKGKVTTVGEGSDAKKKVVLDPSKFDTKLTFATHIEEVLLDNGVERNSAEWHSFTQEARTEYGVDKMDRV